MIEVRLVADLAVVLAVALAGGLIAHRLHQPVIIGYLTSGVIVGPYGLKLIGELGQVQALAEIGVALLMFTIGVQFSFHELRQVRNVAIWGGIIQIGLTIVLGIAAASLLGWSSLQGIFFGSLIALSSTIVVLKTLIDRGEQGSLHSRIMVGLLIIQDLSVIPMMVILISLGGPEQNIGISLSIAILKAAVFLIAMLFLGTRWIPILMAKVAELRSRELFLLFVITLCLGTAITTNLFGLSFALGAFIAGLVISESDFATQALAEVIPLRDIFALLFFVSIGMLTDVRFFVQNPSMVALVVGLIVFSRFILCSALPVLFGYAGKTALRVGLGMIQIGEFSFLLAKLGLERGILSEYLYSLTLASAIVTILLTPLAMNLSPLLIGRLSRFKPLSPWWEKRFDPVEVHKGQGLRNHVVVCGYGDVSRNLLPVLDRRGFSYLVIDYDPHVFSILRKKGIPSIYGDATNPYVLSQADLDKARVLVVTTPDRAATEMAVRNALNINPKLDIVARTPGGTEINVTPRAGFLEIVQPEFEAGLEIIRHTLHRFGVTSQETQYVVNSIRLERTKGGVRE